jgi:hypothetical protein
MTDPLRTRRNDGIVLARTREGFDLPVIDLSNPRFATPDDPATVQRLSEALIAAERRQRRIPQIIMRMILRVAARKSRLVRAMFHSQAGYLDSISTYVMKLGAENLVPPYDSPTDRQVASSPHVLLIRLRMQQIAHFVADGLAHDLTSTDAAAPLRLINIGGGPALDSINALIALRRARPELLNRPVVIDVLDSNEDGAFFGANALEALKTGGGPLAKLDIAMQHHDYDWNQPAVLADLVGMLASAGAVIAASSEGALFEYGSDEAIVANLKARGRLDNRCGCLEAAVDREHALPSEAAQHRRLHAACHRGRLPHRHVRNGLHERPGASATAVTTPADCEVPLSS